MAEQSEDSKLLGLIGAQSGASYADLHKEIGLYEYLNLLTVDARPARSSHQRLYDMIIESGVEDVKVFGDDKKKYRFFSPANSDGTPHEDAIYGMEQPLMDLVAYFRNAALRLGGEKRLLLLHGPVGSAKSTIVRILKKGLENYSKTNPIFAFRWADKDDVFKKEKLIEAGCQLREDPIRLLMPEERDRVLDLINEANAKEGSKMKYPVEIKGDICPACSFNMDKLLRYYGGDWKKVVENHVKVFRYLISESNRVGIGSFQPKDEKNQDSTELTGDMNYRKIAIFGSDSDPRAFNFDGEFCIANRGLIEMVELLKLDVAFLYDLLGATQENVIKPKKFPQTSVDEVIIGHTNEEEFKKFHGNKFMEALKNRTIKIDIPYNVKLEDETRVYTKLYTPKRVKKHIAPHTLEIAATFAILSRLEDPLDKNISLLDKLRLYDGKIVRGYTPDVVKKMRQEIQREGLDGISPRFIQNALGEAVCKNEDVKCIDPFMLMNEIANGLLGTSTLVDKEQAQKYSKTILEISKKVVEEMVKEDVIMAVAGDEATIVETFDKYMDNVKAFLSSSTVFDKAKGVKVKPDESFMKSIEEKMGITEAGKQGHRQTIMSFVGQTAISKEPFTYKSNDELRRAIRDKIFEDYKGTINWASVSAGGMDRITEGKIGQVNKWLMENGYCEHCSNNALRIAQNIFARENSGNKR